MNEQSLRSQLQALMASLYQLAQEHQSDSLTVLMILREVERSHREICEMFFHTTLPSSRHEFYDLLQAIEAEGGWPYIPRPKLQNLLEHCHDAD